MSLLYYNSFQIFISSDLKKNKIPTEEKVNSKVNSEVIKYKTQNIR